MFGSFGFDLFVLDSFVFDILELAVVLVAEPFGFVLFDVAAFDCVQLDLEVFVVV